MFKPGRDPDHPDPRQRCSRRAPNSSLADAGATLKRQSSITVRKTLRDQHEGAKLWTGSRMPRPSGCSWEWSAARS